MNPVGVWQANLKLAAGPGFIGLFFRSYFFSRTGMKPPSRAMINMMMASPISLM
jgi:hypothetical protein